MEKQGTVIEVNDPARFEKLPDGWIKDHLLRKEHGPSSDRMLNEEESKEFCAKLGGEEPTAAEAASIVNFEGDPAFFSIFADTKTDGWYRTKTLCPWYWSCVRIVSYGSGYVSYSYEDSRYYVRPVRASQ